MGRYTIEINDAFVEDCGMKKLLLQIKLNECGSYWLPTGITLTPYTEPDIDAIRKEAYDQGRKYGKIEGQAEAWACVKKIAFKPEIVECVDDLVRMGFDVGTADSWSEAIELLFDKYSASEVIEKVRQYEREKEKQEEKDSVTAEDVMRQYLDAFCHGRNCEGCPLETYGFTCGRGSYFINTRNPVSDEEVRKAYTTVLQKMKEK